MDMDAPDTSSGNLWGRLPLAVQLHVLSLLPPNDRALSGRLTCRDASSHLSKANNASLALPLPPHAPHSAQAAGRLYMQQLPFRRKLGLLCTAAASGCEANLEAALAVIQPSIFPEMLQSGNKSWKDRHTTPHDPGVAAVRAGHPQLLGWLLRRCPALVHPQGVLNAAAQHCDLAGLQAAWEALRHWSSSSDSSSSEVGSGCTRGGNSIRVSLCQEVLDAAAQSKGSDAVPKLEWLLAAGGGSCHLRESTAAAAARSGDLGRLRWLHERGCPMNDPNPMGSPSVLAGALQYADLVVAQWLVDEAGCALPSARGSSSPWRALLKAAARGSEAASKIEWLEELLLPPWTLDDLLLGGTAYALVQGGQVEVLQYLQFRPALVAAHGQEWWVRVHNAAVASGSILLVEHLWQEGWAFTRTAYCSAFDAHCLPMVRWLAVEAGVSAAMLGRSFLGRAIACWPSNTASDERDLLEAVQLLVGTAGHRGWDCGHVVCAAVTRGNLPLVQCLLQQRREFQLNASHVHFAVKAGCEDLLDWLLELVVEQADFLDGLAGPDGSPYIPAAVNGDRDTLTALRQVGVPWCAEDVVARAVKSGCGLPVLRWLVQEGAPVGSRRDMAQAIAWKVGEGRVDAQTEAWLLSLAAAYEADMMV